MRRRDDRPKMTAVVGSMPLSRRVRGTLFVDYVRMLRAHKGVDWSLYLTAEDLAYLAVRVVPTDFYPMESFERMGLAILAEVAHGDLALVEAFGQASVDWLVQQHPNLLVPGAPRESLMRFQVLRRGFFDYPALELDEINDQQASMRVSYGMGDAAEQAASHQTLGFFARLLEVAGAKDREVRFVSKSWAGAAATVIAMKWRR
jgi:hypothetical protein